MFTRQNAQDLCVNVSMRNTLGVDGFECVCTTKELYALTDEHNSSDI